VVTYELLFRGRADAVTAGQRRLHATSQVILTAFTQFGIEEIVGDRLCFINLTREFLTGAVGLPFGPDRVVLEVLETVAVDDEVIAGVGALVAAGYRIALDDFVWGHGHERLLPMASYVKIDMLDGDVGRLDQVVAACRRYRSVQLVAEKLETAEHIALADRYGCELRQGYALMRPVVLSTVSLSPSRARRLELLAALGEPDADLDTVMSIIDRDAALSMRVLRACNSAAVGAAARVSSIRHAVVMLGLAQIRHWAMLMVIDEVAPASEDRLTAAIAHGRMCHRVAGMTGASADAAFTAGLLTGVAGLMGMPAPDLVARLPVNADISTAITDGTGPLGHVLRIVDRYESGDDAVSAGGADPARMATTYLDAVRWSNRAVQATRSG
jgi:c-di-GMP-related signal transduction protein